MTWQNRIIDAGEVAPGELAANPKNWRVHPEAQAAALGDMLDTVGWVTGVIVNRRTGLIVDGHLRVSMALQRGEATIPVQYVDLAPAEEDIVLAAIDPISMLAGRNQQTLSELVNGLTLAPGPLESMLDRLVGEKAKPGKTDADALPSGIPPRTAPGDLWVLGPHRVLCGDSTKVADVKRLFGGTQPAVMLTDPPYCSGGFQEAGKRAGSVGTRGDIMVANDTLSTRGYLALMKGVIGAAGVDAVYVFTDWRMVKRWEEYAGEEAVKAPAAAAAPSRMRVRKVSSV